MLFELWDMRSRNGIGSFASEAEALHAVQKLIEEHGRSFVDELFLGCEDDQGNSKPVAKGKELADLALRSGRPSVVKV